MHGRCPPCIPRHIPSVSFAVLPADQPFPFSMWTHTRCAKTAPRPARMDDPVGAQHQGSICQLSARHFSSHSSSKVPVHFVKTRLPSCSNLTAYLFASPPKPGLSCTHVQLNHVLCLRSSTILSPKYNTSNARLFPFSTLTYTDPDPHSVQHHS